MDGNAMGAFVAALKKRLLDADAGIEQQGRDTQGGYSYVSWHELEREIDAFCAEWQKK